MRALLLSGSIGMGHDVMAEACANSLRPRGWDTATMDSLRLMGNAAGGMGERAFRAVLAVPGAYDAFHFEQLRTGGRLATLAERASSKYAVPALTAELAARPAELVISVFATGASAAGRVRAERDFVNVVFCTDVCPHRLWVHENTDLYLVTSQTSAAFVRRFHPRAQTAVVPTPVRPQFYAAPSAPEARQSLGIPDGEPCVLLMSGAWGLGPVAELAESLARDGVWTVVVAGRNGALEGTLREIAARQPRLVPFGFTDRIPELMSAADLVITSSGDTCTEARVVGRHLLLLDVVPGHGRENLQHQLELGAADVAPADPDGLRAAVLGCLDRLEPASQQPTQTPDEWERSFEAALNRVGLTPADT
jgi:UDP-N-acetylglucosamine:LPS N-acetylglucosamine transferase